MLNRYRLYRRKGGFLAGQRRLVQAGKPADEGSRSRGEAALHSKNEAYHQPSINLAIARTYLAAHDPKVATRTWADVMGTTELE